jgi:hypothetical protein
MLDDFRNILQCFSAFFGAGFVASAGLQGVSESTKSFGITLSCTALVTMNRRGIQLCYI